MKTLFALFFLLAPPFEFIQQRSNEIAWTKERKLVWTDFKGTPERNDKESAGTTSGIYYNYSFSGDSIRISIGSYFDRLNSFVIVDDTTDNLLKHEQGHFDLSELYARKFRKYLHFIGKINSDSFGPQIKILSARYSDSLDREQDLYDKETEHSKNKTEQKNWNTKILKMLKEYGNYSDTVTRVKLYN